MYSTIFAVILAITYTALAIRQYDVRLVYVSDEPVVSHVNKRGAGHTPCNLTFNPSWLPAGPGLSQSGMPIKGDAWNQNKAKRKKERKKD